MRDLYFGFHFDRAGDRLSRLGRFNKVYEGKIINADSYMVIVCENPVYPITGDLYLLCWGVPLDKQL